MAYLEEQEHTHKKLEYYLAQIAAEVRMGNMHLMFKEKKVTDMLLNFVSADEHQTQVMQSKSAWGMALGVNTDPTNN